MLPEHVHIQEQYYALPTLKLAALASVAQANKPILLCLHGWLDNAASFTPLCAYLADYQVIALDWPGHGKSTHRSVDAHYHFVDYISDLYQLFELNSWRTIDIVGHSMGAMIACAFAAAFPERVKSLTLIDAIGFLTEAESNTSQQLREGIMSRFQGQTKQKTWHATLDVAIKARMNVSDLSYANAKLLVERGVCHEIEGVTWRSDSRIRTKSLTRLSKAQALQLVQDIQAPVQLIYGSQGMQMVQLGLAQFQHGFGKLSVHKLSGGHHVHMEQPEQTADLIRTFIG
jgi:pimeloyl-ACP methyl ester carboxylesterase